MPRLVFLSQREFHKPGRAAIWHLWLGEGGELSQANFFW